MSTETDDADTAADRLEAALERIALGVSQARGLVQTDAAVAAAAAPETAEIATRLDGLILRLRAALAAKQP
jgi:hypothetical protein